MTSRINNTQGTISILLLGILLLVTGLLMSSTNNIQSWLKLEQARFTSYRAQAERNQNIYQELMNSKQIALLECFGEEQLCAINANQTTQTVIPDWEYYFKNAYECSNYETVIPETNTNQSNLTCLDTLPTERLQIYINSNYQSELVTTKDLEILAIAGAIKVDTLTISSGRLLILALDEIIIEQIYSENSTEIVIFSASNKVTITQPSLNTQIHLLANVHSLSDYQWIKTLPALTIGLLNAP